MAGRFSPVLFTLRAALPQVDDHLPARIAAFDHVRTGAELAIRRVAGDIRIRVFGIQSTHILPHQFFDLSAIPGFGL